jgi:hypothetical protein
MKIALSYDDNVKHVWSTPVGFGLAMERAGHQVDHFGFDPQNCSLSNLVDQANSYDLIVFMIAGPSASFDAELMRLKQNTKTKIFLEAGDDLPNSGYHANRVNHVDGIFTPDYRCHLNYTSKKLPSVWFPVWCDDEIFYYDKSIPRENVCVTTCGERPNADLLQRLFLEKFINKRVSYGENTKLFNSGTISYQYARYDEVTRRLVEAGGCKLAILTNRISEDSGINILFKEDENICYFSSQEECVQKITKLFYDEEYRDRISKNMYNLIQQKHLIKHRISDMIDYYSRL